MTRQGDRTLPGPAVWAAALLFVVVLAMRIRSELTPAPTPPPPAPPAAPASTSPDAPPPPPVFTTPSTAWPRDPLVAELNLDGGTIEADLAVVATVLDAWTTNFPGMGHPVGDNREITAALTGRNALHLALVPANHPAINAEGELCDRHGTPLFFHQISGQQMEIRSAGTDRRLFTPDDVRWSPSGRSDHFVADAGDAPDELE